MDDHCHCPTQAEHDDRIAKVCGTSDLQLIADAREYLRRQFERRHFGWTSPSPEAVLPQYVLDRIREWAS